MDAVLSLFPSQVCDAQTLRIGETEMPAQLLLGYGVWDEYDQKNLITSET